MLIFKLDVILNKERISQNQFARLSGIRPNTINNIVNNNIKRLEISTLEKILSVLLQLGYQMEDFMIYSKEEN